MDAEFLKYQYEDGYDGVNTRRKLKIGVRHIQIIYMLLCSTVLGVLRGSTGVAVLAVTDTTRLNDTYIHIHNWDRRIQGTILASFFFGYALMLVPAELYLRKFGCKLVLTAVLVVNGALCVAMPTIVNKGGWIAVCNAQFLMGLTQACLSPSHKALLAKWLPPNERSLLGSLVYGGVHLGVIIGLPVSGILSEEHLGWELIYYAQAMLTLSMATVWGLLTASSPEQHQAVGDTEKEYIQEALSCYRKKRLQTPWRCIIKSPQLWAVACAHMASNAIFIFYLVDVPLYLQTFGMSLRESSWKSMLPFIVMWTSYVTSAPMIDWLYKIGCVSYILSITHYRKLINVIGAFGSAIGLTVLSILGPDSAHLAIILLMAIFGLLGFQFSGYLENLKEISQNYSGTLMMLSSVLASTFGALVPLVTGLVVGEDVSDFRGWQIMFLTLASFSVVCNIVYMILGCSDRREWDSAGEKRKIGYHNGVIDTNQLELEELSHEKQQSRYNDTAL